MRKRLAEFHNHSEPVIAFYRSMKLVRDIDATKNIDVVKEEIRKYFSK